MTTPVTKELYKQLRAAMMSRDDAASIGILKRIIAADPGDEAARKQLSTLTAGAQKSGSAPAGKKKEKSATAALYQRYRSACLAHNDMEAFSLLEEILSKDPDDKEAVQQKMAVGKRIATGMSAELTATVNSGEISRITTVVEKLQRYADDDVLQALPDYRTAVNLQREAQERAAKEHVARLLSEFDKQNEPFARNDKAISIEKYAEEHGVTLPAEISEKLQQAQEAWQQLCRESEQYETFNKLADEYRQLKQDVQLRENLQNSLPTLQRLREGVKALSEVPEVDFLVEQMDKTKKKIIAAQREQNCRKKVLRFLMMGALALLAVMGVLMLYAHSSVDSRCEELARAMGSKNVQGTTVLVKKAYPMAHLYTRINGAYAELLTRARAWLNEYKALNAQIAAYEKWLEGNVGSGTLSDSEEFLQNISRGAQLFTELVEKYNEEPSSELVNKHERGCIELQNLKSKAIGRFTNPPADAGMEVLDRMYQEYKSLRGLMAFSDEENAAVRAAFLQRVESLLFRELTDEAAIGKSTELCRKYMGPMELPADLLTRLDGMKAELSLFRQLAHRLKLCSSLDEYIRELRRCEKYLSNIPGCCMPAALAEFGEELPDHLLQVRVESNCRPLAGLTAHEIRQKLQGIKNIYSGGGNLFSDFNREKFKRTVDKMTLPEKSPHWSDKFRQITCGEKVYIGKISKINDVPYIREVERNGSLSDKQIKIVGVYKNKALRMEHLRAAVGIRRMDLQSGEVLPTDLMLNLAKETDEHYSPLARAWLFSLCIDLLDCMSAHDSGLAFSAGLRADIKKFKELEQWLANHQALLTENCWTLRHSTESERRIRIFFDGVAKRDYAGEIASTIDKLLNGRCVLCGYVNEKGEYVATRVRSGVRLYLYSRGKLEPLRNGMGAPYAPVFSIEAI